jgi:hypothetical protein
MQNNLNAYTDKDSAGVTNDFSSIIATMLQMQSLFSKPAQPPPQPGHFAANSGQGAPGKLHRCPCHPSCFVFLGPSTNMNNFVTTNIAETTNKRQVSPEAVKSPKVPGIVIPPLRPTPSNRL